jgi:hypothetical protein
VSFVPFVSDPWGPCLGNFVVSVVALVHATAPLSTPDGQVEILCRPGHVESHLERIAAFEDPTIAYRFGRIEHPGKEPIESHLPAQAMQINSVPTRPFVEPRLESGSKRAGGGVLALSCHQVPASEFYRSVVVPEC